MENIIPTTIRITEETKKAIEDIAILEKRSFNKMIQYILDMYIIEYMKEQEEKEKND